MTNTSSALSSIQSPTIIPPELTWTSWRYSMVRWWTCPLTCIPHWMPLFGGRTVPEISSMAGILTVLLGAGIPQYGGRLESFMSIIAFILVFFILRSNYLLRAIGVSYERGIVFHKVTGLLLCAVAIAHAVRNGLNTSGYVLTIAILVAGVTYLFEYLGGYFNTFYYLHLLGAITIIPSAFVHGRPYIAIAKFLWVADVIIRNFIKGFRVIAKVRFVGNSTLKGGDGEGNIVCLEIPIAKVMRNSNNPNNNGNGRTTSWSGTRSLRSGLLDGGNDNGITSTEQRDITRSSSVYGRDINKLNYFPIYTPGQYCFLMIPKINKVEYHPFTIASASFNHPNREDYVIFYIKRSGDWTNALMNIVKECQEKGNDKDLEVYVEGPYGILSIEMFNTEVYRTVVLISGGVGVTPMISLLSAMMRERINDKDTLLVNKDDNDGNKRESEQERETEKDVVPLSPEDSSVIIQQPRDITAFCQGKEFSHPRRTVYFYWVARDKALIEEVIEHVFTPLFTELDFSLLINSDDRRVWRCTSTSVSPSVVEEVQLLIHYSNKGGKTVDQDGLFEGFVSPALKRIPLPAFFDELQKRERSIRQWRILDERRVAVAVCGPTPMVAEVRAICDLSTTCFMQGYDPEHVRFDCHEEIFQF